MKIIKKALTKEKYKLTYDVMNSTNFPWYYSDSSVDGDKISYFSHLFIKFGQTNSDFTYLLEPFYPLMKPSKLLHIRANLTVSKNKIFETPFHTDYHEQDPKHRTAIFYLNNNHHKDRIYNLRNYYIHVNCCIFYTSYCWQMNHHFFPIV